MMKFTINRRIFDQALKVVAKAASSKTPIDVLKGIKILATSSGILLTGSDATITIEDFISSDNDQNQLTITEKGAIILDSSLLSSLISKLPGEQVTLEVTSNFQTVIASGNSEYTLNGQNPDDYPRLPEIDPYSTFKIPGNLFKKVINQTIISVSTNEIRPIFTGIHVELSNNDLKLVATDSHRLSQRIVPLESPKDIGDEPIVLNIPGNSLSELKKIVSDDEDIDIQVTNNQILFKVGTTSLYSNLLEGMFPNTDNLLTNSEDTILDISSTQLISAVARAKVLLASGSNKVVKLELDENKVVLSGHSAQVGNFEEELDILGADGNPLSISFNPDYLESALKTFDGQDVRIKFQTASRPFLIVPKESADSFEMLQLITPIRTPGSM
ncbi:DNA polymerase III subunit beta [Aerococcus suis]|uniref:Beta sliding clamp n=1 Tax=Aerococcus suis TaxID=371602 RepID=A0A1W1ZBQ1_9LACT|nr:DNA polymerase III subunit beta [Aerococcus suis]SMC45840.1 DNA polymerase III, beta subunit [Aerococcus suis]